MKSARKTVYREHALLVSVIPTFPKSIGTSLRSAKSPKDNDSLVELEQLVNTAGAIIVDRITQKKDKPEVTFYIGRGKAAEIRELVLEHEIDVVIFDNELSPAQVRNLEKELQTKVIDRTELILDIFATHARSQQANLQVELAQLEYTLPRLKRMWTHLSRIEGGIGIGQRGPGEKKIEMDRRLARDRITKIKREIVEINKRRQRDIEQRSEYFNISLIGYTNAGKSTLMNTLTGTDCFVEDKLFSTLDTKTNLWHLGKYKALLSDTVGFIKNLPHNLIASFHATLQETISADLLLHVIDISQHNVSEHIEAVNKVLNELGCGEKRRLLVFNKIDQSDPLDTRIITEEFPDAVLISAREKTGLDELAGRVIKIIEENEIESTFSIPVGNGKLRAYLAEHGQILKESYTDSKVRIKMKLTPQARARVVHHLKEARKEKGIL